MFRKLFYCGCLLALVVPNIGSSCDVVCLNTPPFLGCNRVHQPSPTTNGPAVTVEPGGTVQIVVNPSPVEVEPLPPLPPPPPLTVSFTDVQPTGGTFDTGGHLTFHLTVNVAGGNGQQLAIRCLPYACPVLDEPCAFNTAFTATNGDQIVNVVIALPEQTNLGNNYFYIYDAGHSISQPWTVSIKVVDP